MSEASSVGPEKTTPPKTPTSPARNALGLIVLVGVIAFGVYEYSAKSGYNKAVTALDARTQDEDKGLATVSEAEALLGKEADGPAADFKEGPWSFNKKTYTWKGLIKNYTLTAYYTKEQDSRLHHFETEGQKYDLTPPKTGAPPAAAPTGGQAARGGTGKGGGRGGNQQKSKGKSDSGSPDKSATPSDKAAAPKPDDAKGTDTAPKSAPASNSAPKATPPAPSDTDKSTAKPATDPAPATPPKKD